MDWGLRPCWVEGCADEGVRFIRQFPQLELLTLLVKFNENWWAESDARRNIEKTKRLEIRRISAYVMELFSREKKWDHMWNLPHLRVVAQRKSTVA